MNTRVPVGIVILLLVSACSDTEEGDQSRVVAQQRDEAPVIQHVDGGDMTTTAVAVPPQIGPKLFVVDMSVDAAGATMLVNPRVQYGEAPNDLGTPPMFSAHLLDAVGTILDAQPLWDPRWTFVWSDEEDRDFVDLGESGKVTVILRFDAAAVTIALLKDKERLAAIDVTGAVAEFCRKNRDDPDCRDRVEQEPVQ